MDIDFFCINEHDAVAVNYKTYKTIRLFYKTDFEAKIILLKESYSLLPIL